MSEWWDLTKMECDVLLLCARHIISPLIGRCCARLACLSAPRPLWMPFYFAWDPWLGKLNISPHTLNTHFYDAHRQPSDRRRRSQFALGQEQSRLTSNGRGAAGQQIYKTMRPPSCAPASRSTLLLLLLVVVVLAVVSAAAAASAPAAAFLAPRFVHARAQRQQQQARGAGGVFMLGEDKEQAIEEKQIREKQVGGEGRTGFRSLMSFDDASLRINLSNRSPPTHAHRAKSSWRNACSTSSGSARRGGRRLWRRSGTTPSSRIAIGAMRLRPSLEKRRGRPPRMPRRRGRGACRWWTRFRR